MSDEKATEGNVVRPPPAPSTGPLSPAEMGGLVFSVRLASPARRQAAALQNPLPPWLRERNGS